MQFAFVVIVPKDKAVLSRAFEEVVMSMHYALIELGHQSTIVENRLVQNVINIIVGANLQAEQLLAANLPANTIIFNFEQLFIGSPWLSPSYIDLLKRYRVWDYSLFNLATYKKLGIHHVTHLPLGYVNQLARIPNNTKDIDVLFYGAVNERRAKILDELIHNKINVVSLYSVFGAERDEYIARSKIILNMHFFDAKVFEIVRIFYLLANQQFVITESSTNIEDESAFANGMVICDYDKLASTCLEYLKSPEQCEKIAQQGFEIMRNRLQKDFLAPVIAQL